MKREEAFKLTPEISYVMYAEGKYRVAYVAEEFGVTWIGIYDEPPSLHVDRVTASNCAPLPPAEGAEEYLKLPQNDGKLKYCPAHFFPTLIQLMEGFAAQPQPTVKGAEEILQKYMDMSMIICPLHVVPRTVALDAMYEFATLHAQKIFVTKIKHKR